MTLKRIVAGDVFALRLPHDGGFSLVQVAAVVHGGLALIGVFESLAETPEELDVDALLAGAPVLVGMTFTGMMLDEAEDWIWLAKRPVSRAIRTPLFKEFRSFSNETYLLDAIRELRQGPVSDAEARGVPNQKHVSASLVPDLAAAVGTSSWDRRHDEWLPKRPDAWDVFGEPEELG